MKTIFTILAILIALGVAGQITISGTVETKKGEPIPGVNIFIEDTYDGGSSDADGKFSFVTYETGIKKLLASFIGYRKWEKEIDLLSDVDIRIEMQESTNTIDAVTITAGSFAADDKSRASVMKPLDIYTTPSAVGDIMGAVRTMPGTQISADDGRLLVRGGDVYETSTYIDGLVVQNPYYSKTPDIATRGRFSPSLFEGIQFNTGGYSAEYGQALSSVLVLNSTDIDTEDNTGISLMGIGGEANHTFCGSNSSLMLSAAHYNYTLYDKIFESNIDKEKPIKLYNGTAVYRFKPRPSALLKAYATSDNSNVSYRVASDNLGNKMLISSKTTAVYSNISYRDCFSEKSCYKIGVSSSFQYGKLDIDGDDVKTKEKKIEARFSVLHDIADGIKLNYGISETYNNYDQDYILEEGAVFNGNFNDHLIGAFIEPEIKFSKNFAVRTGLRGEYSSVIGKWSAAPRLSLAWKTGKQAQLSAAWGLYYQTPQSDYLKYATNLDFEQATHYILSYQYGKSSTRLFRIEAYYKVYDNLVTYDIGEYGLPTNLHNNGNGYAAGVDIFWSDKKSIKGFDYRINYSYVDTKRKYKYFPEKATPSFIADHTFSAVTKYWINKISTQVGASFSAASGKPYNNPNSDKFNDERTNTYSDLSLNCSHVFYIKNQYSVLYCSLNNVFGNNNILSYRTTNISDEQGNYVSIPVKRNYRRMIFVGLFLNL